MNTVQISKVKVGDTLVDSLGREIGTVARIEKARAAGYLLFILENEAKGELCSTRTARQYPAGHRTGTCLIK